MQFRIDRQPPPLADMAQRLAARLAHEGIRAEPPVTIPPDPAYMARRARSLRRLRAEHERIGRHSRARWRELEHTLLAAVRDGVEPRLVER